MNNHEKKSGNKLDVGQAPGDSSTLSLFTSVWARDNQESKPECPASVVFPNFVHSGPSLLNNDRSL